MAEARKQLKTTSKLLRQRGLRRRWMQTSVLPVLLLVVVIAVLASTGMSNYYYNSMLDGLQQQVQAQAGAFNDYFMNNGYADYYQKAVQTTADFRTRTVLSCSSSAAAAASRCPPPALPPAALRTRLTSVLPLARTGWSLSGGGILPREKA